VFQQAGSDAFAQLEGRYFGVPRWLVRFVDWGAEPAERVEEYRVWVGPDAEVSRVSHTLPEARPGASLPLEAARRLALEAVTVRYGVAAGDLREVEAEETSQPNRTDWLFTFTETGRLTDIGGEVRFQVRVAGGEVTDVAPTIHVPEDWERALRRSQSRNQILRGGLMLLLLVGFGGLAVTGVVVWSRGRLPAGVMWKLTATAFVALVASSANDWPATAAAFGTGQPWSFQVGATVIGLALAACLVAPAIGLVGALAHVWLGSTPRQPVPPWTGSAIGVALGGLAVLGSTLVPRPPGAGYFGAAAAVPMLSATVSVIPAFLLTTSGVLVLAALRERFRDRAFVGSTIWSLVMAAAVVLVPAELQVSALTWVLGALVVAGGLTAGLFVCFTRPGTVPSVVASVFAITTVVGTWAGPYAGARVGGLIAALVLVLLAWVWTGVLTGPGGAGAQSPAETRASVGSE